MKPTTLSALAGILAMSPMLAQQASPSKASKGAWFEDSGILIIEPEHGNLASDWTTRLNDFSDDPTMSGSSGNGWLEWTGKQYFGNTAKTANGVLTYTFTIRNPGDYIFRWRSKQYKSVPSGDAGNDTFVRFASGTPVDGFQDFSNFTKVWVQSRDAWSWNTNFEPKHGVFISGDKVRRHFPAGTHSIQLAARSPGHSIDRIILHRTDVPFDDATFTSIPESKREGRQTDETQYTFKAISDFLKTNTGTVPYYIDKKQNALAIDAANVKFREKFARALTTFKGDTGKYNITINALGELDGECTYRLYVNDKLIGSRQNTTVTTDYSAQQHIFRNITVPAGATLAVESNAVSNGLIPEGDGFAFARGRWTSLSLAPTTLSATPKLQTDVHTFASQAISTGAGSISYNEFLAKATDPNGGPHSQMEAGSLTGLSGSVVTRGSTLTYNPLSGSSDIDTYQRRTVDTNGAETNAKPRTRVVDTTAFVESSTTLVKFAGHGDNFTSFKDLQNLRYTIERL